MKLVKNIETLEFNRRRLDKILSENRWGTYTYKKKKKNLLQCCVSCKQNQHKYTRIKIIVQSTKPYWSAPGSNRGWKRPRPHSAFRAEEEFADLHGLDHPKVTIVVADVAISKRLLMLAEQNKWRR